MINHWQGKNATDWIKVARGLRSRRLGGRLEVNLCQMGTDWPLEQGFGNKSDS